MVLYGVVLFGVVLFGVVLFGVVLFEGVHEFHSSGANKEPVALCNGQK